MSKIKFDNKITKERYDELVNSWVAQVIDESVKNYTNVIIKVVFLLDRYLYIDVFCDESNVRVAFDYFKFTIIVSDRNNPYQTVYDNPEKKVLSPDYFIYKNEDKKIIKRNIVSINNNGKMNNYEFYINDKAYFIKIVGDIDDTFIRCLLNFSNINNINDLIKVLQKIIDFSNIELYIKEAENNVYIKNGELKSYNFNVENKGDFKEDIYYKDNNYFLRRTTTQKLENNNSFIKKLGVYDGKGK